MKRKFLCVCHGGNHRSHAMAYVLKSRGQEAISCGVDHTSPESFAKLAEWADEIIATIPSALSVLMSNPSELVRSKSRLVLDFGEDTGAGFSLHPKFIQTAQAVADQIL